MSLSEIPSRERMLDNRPRVYALASWTVKSNGKGWFLRNTDSTEEWRGSVRREASICLTIGSADVLETAICYNADYEAKRNNHRALRPIRLHVRA